MDFIYCKDKTIDIIAMSETWLDSDDNLNESSIMGMKCVENTEAIRKEVLQFY